MKKLISIISAFCLLLLFLPGTGQAQYEEPSKFAFRGWGGLGFVSGGDLNDGLEGWANLWKALFGLLGATSSGNYEGAKMGMNFGGDFIFLFNPTMGLGLGGEYLQASKDSSVAHTVLGSTLNMSYETKINAIPLKLSFFYFIPAGQSLTASVHAGVGYYLAKAKYTELWTILGDWDQTFWDLSGGGIGFHGGVGLEFKVAPMFALFIEAAGRYASFGGFEGDADYTDSYGYSASESGTLYFYRGDAGTLGSFNLVTLDTVMPSGSGVSDAREAKINFSGFRIVIGFVVRI